MIKVVILLAGKGRRIQSDYGGMHKALITLNGEKLIVRLLKCILSAGGTSIVPILGYSADLLLKEINKVDGFSSVDPVFNYLYETTNNLYSLLQAEQLLAGDDFIVINGDMVFDYRILQHIIEFPGSAIGTDGNKYDHQLDSPRLLINDNRIYDLGRHRTIEESQGYAIGIYRFSKTISEEFFSLGKEMVKVNPNAGYHDPLVKLFHKHIVRPCYTENYLWMDVDEKADVPKAEKMIIAIERMQNKALLEMNK